LNTLQIIFVNFAAMKLFTSILLLTGWLAMGLTSELHSFPSGEKETVAQCGMSCCKDGAGCCTGEADDQSPGDHQCAAGCDCTCQNQALAIGFDFQTGFVPHLSAMEYKDYRNSYAYEFTPPLFHPPRFG